MAKRSAVPEGFESFPEEERLRTGPMRDEILFMVVEALNRQGHPDVTAETVQRDPRHRELAVDTLRDCRPLPVIVELIAELERPL
jgi:hypothetical protein